jgi:hypothetical protein
MMWLRRRRLLLVGLAAVAVVGVAIAFVLLVPHPHAGITLENNERIRPGMTLEEVEAILGGPPGDYTDGRFKPLLTPAVVEESVQTYIGPSPSATARPPGRWECWVGEGITVWVRTDGSGHVTRRELEGATAVEQTLWDRLCRLLHL